MEHYVTLFDSLFLPQALALHASMERHCAPYHLWMICVDEQSFSVLLNLDLHNVSLLNLGNVETTSLKEVKPSMTHLAEHTSDLQSLLRISYAVFSFTKQN